MPHQKKIRVFDYLDYRQFLKDWCQHAKDQSSYFSFRSLSKKMGFGSPNFLNRVIQANRNLTDFSATKVAHGLGLLKNEAEFFKSLVAFNQASTHPKKSSCYKRVLQLQQFARIKPIQQHDQLNYYSVWYHPVIRELVLSKNFDGTPEWLANRLDPPITAEQAQQSVALLQKLGLIKKDVQGLWEQAHPVVSTGSEGLNLLMDYHKHVSTVIKEQMTKVPAQQRDINTLTLGTSKEKYAIIKKKIKEFRSEILKLVSDDTNPDEVFLLTIHLLPATKDLKKHDSQ